MTTFDERERAFENKFVLDQEQEFRAHARRDRMLGLWAGEKLGRSGEALEAYAAQVVREEVQEDGEALVFNKVFGDLLGLATAEEVRDKMDELLRLARTQVADGADRS